MNQAVNLTAQRIGQAGRGKLVLAHGSVAVTFNKLLEQAKRGNYWATFIVREIEQLTAGVNNSKQVYTHEKLRAGGYANYRMVLPGCSATIVCTPSGEYNIYALEVDFDYFQKQEEAKKPGLHFVRKGREDMWTSSFLSQKEVADNGKKMRQPGFVKAQSANKMDWIIAGVADLNHTPAEAAKEVVTHIAASPYNYPNLSELGFNLMFTPGKGSIGGLFHPREAYNATKSERLNESATILADAMIKAQKKRQKVAWISQLGGSGVLTQALKICKDRNVNLNMQAAYLANPTTSSSRALDLALGLGMQIDVNEEFSKSRVLNLNELVGGNLVGAAPIYNMVKRFRSQEGYGIKQAMWEGMAGYGNGKEVYGTGVAAAALGTAMMSGSLSTVCETIVSSAPIAIAIGMNIPALSRYPTFKAAFNNLDRKLW